MLNGDAQTNRDNAYAVTSWLPLVLGLIRAVTFVCCSSCPAVW